MSANPIAGLDKHRKGRKHRKGSEKEGNIEKESKRKETSKRNQKGNSKPRKKSQIVYHALLQVALTTTCKTVHWGETGLANAGVSLSKFFVLMRYVIKIFGLAIHPPYLYKCKRIGVC